MLNDKRFLSSSEVERIRLIKSLEAIVEKAGGMLWLIALAGSR
jgi:hypothetical protein